MFFSTLYLTYKELRPIRISWILAKIDGSSGYTLPIRNWDLSSTIPVLLQTSRNTLPIRNWDILVFNHWPSLVWVVNCTTLPIRNWDLTTKSFVSPKMKSYYLTYKELRHTCFRSFHFLLCLLDGFRYYLAYKELRLYNPSFRGCYFSARFKLYLTYKELRRIRSFFEISSWIL